MPEKVMKDCAGCIRQHACDEVALEFKIKSSTLIHKEAI
jgi:argininosuccinate lyase/amino-acid N-acetyltransferase